MLIPGDTTPTLLATIARITIKGTAIGSTSIFTGLTAQKIGRLVVTGVVKDISGAANVLLDPTNADFRAVDFA